MKSHEIKMASSPLATIVDDIKPVIPAGASDTAALDAVFETLIRSGREAPTAKLMLVPEAWQIQARPAARRTRPCTNIWRA
jgi:glutamate synthase (NADPH/NADH) large chain